MGFKKFNGKNVFLSMILCSAASFSLLHANDLKECESEEDKKVGCVEYSVVEDYMSETPYKDGKIEGILKSYYKGNLYLEIPFKNGVKHGIQKSYYKSGNLREETLYKNDEKEGVEKTYYPNGNLAIEIPYTNDEINGVVKVYYKRQKLIWQANAQNGNLTSGKCSNGKALTNAHLIRLSNEIKEIDIDYDYWYDICKQ